jgi:hypothetical protein
VGGVDGSLLQRLDHDGFDRVIADQARCSRTGLVMQSFEPMLDESTTPLPDRGSGHSEAVCHFGVVTPVGACQHDPAPQGECLCARWAARPTFERRPLVVTQHHRLKD